MIGPVLLFAGLASGVAECRPEAPSAMVARATAFGGVIAPSPADAEEAEAAGMIAKEAARRYLALELPPFLIAPRSIGARPWLDRGCGFVFPWQFPRTATGEPHLPAHVLPHEIGHTVFIRFLAPRTGRDEYGGGAPDWLDEMAAIAFEDSAGVRMRRADARRHAARGELIPLTRLLSMPHPEWSARQPTADTLAGSPTRPPASAETPAFYATLCALLDFLIERTGDERVIRLLADQVQEDAPLDRWLLEHSAAGGAGAEGLSRLDSEIREFVLTDPRYIETRGGQARGEGR